MICFRKVSYDFRQNDPEGASYFAITGMVNSQPSKSTYDLLINDNDWCKLPLPSLELKFPKLFGKFSCQNLVKSQDGETFTPGFAAATGNSSACTLFD